ncbi:MAG: Bug family tripartite tricarboxylate transporter substrate binding protein [Chloroflexota bacterium]
MALKVWSRSVPALLLALALLVALPLASFGCSAGASFPTKAVELVVAFPAGGATDVMMRALADGMQQDLGQQVVVVNKGGGNGIIGTGEVARAKADGYQVLVMQAGPGATQPHIEKVDYKVEDFEPLMLVFRNPIFLVAGSHTPWKDAKEFVEDAKKRPGQIKFGASPQGGVPHLVMEFLGQVAGIKVNTVPYQGGGPAMTALLGGHIDVFSGHPADVAPHMGTGKIKILGVYEAERLKEFPDVPTMKEQGFDAQGAVWGGLVVPKGTPKDVQTKLHDAFKKSLESQKTKDAWAKLSMPTSYMTGDKFVQLWKTDLERYGKIIAQLKAEGRL